MYICQILIFLLILCYTIVVIKTDSKMKYTKELSKIGLTENEAIVYTYLLSTTGDQGNTAFLIAKYTKIPRSTVYLTLDSLLQRRLVSSFLKNNVLHYLAENPKTLKLEMQEKLESLENLIPNLLQLRHETNSTSNIKSYSGTEGVRIVFDDIYDDPHKKGIREFHTISNKDLVDFLPKKLPKLIEYKKKINIHTKLIAPQEAKVNPPKEYRPDSHRDVRYLPNGFSMPGTIVVYGNKVAILALQEKNPYSVIIESLVIAQMIDSLFMCIWILSDTN